MGASPRRCETSVLGSCRSTFQSSPDLDRLCIQKIVRGWITGGGRRRSVDGDTSLLLVSG
eukprot:6281493-Pyramimonas_sp.AAC.1